MGLTVKTISDFTSDKNYLPKKVTIIKRSKTSEFGSYLNMGLTVKTSYQKESLS
jgi:hypothetical protein